jgi:hypothetical protein
MNLIVLISREGTATAVDWSFLRLSHRVVDRTTELYHPRKFLRPVNGLTTQFPCWTLPAMPLPRIGKGVQDKPVSDWLFAARYSLVPA